MKDTNCSRVSLLPDMTNKSQSTTHKKFGYEKKGRTEQNSILKNERAHRVHATSDGMTICVIFLLGFRCLLEEQTNHAYCTSC